MGGEGGIISIFIFIFIFIQHNHNHNHNQRNHAPMPTNHHLAQQGAPPAQLIPKITIEKVDNKLAHQAPWDVLHQNNNQNNKKQITIKIM